MRKTDARAPRLIVALDFGDAKSALDFAARLSPEDCRLKVGKELFVAAGPALAEKLMAKGFELFLDLKFHDIPNTVAGACRVAADLGVWMLDMHAAGGRRMMEAAANAVAGFSRPPLLLGVTVLTSMAAEDWREVAGRDENPADAVLRLGRLALESGMDGLVCSPSEVALLRRNLDAGTILVTPGIRLAGAPDDDQRRVMTPADALRAGSDYLVVGRPVTRATDPAEVLRRIGEEIRNA